MMIQKDKTIIRDLARQVADMADNPVQDQRRELWKKHNSLRPCRPMMLIFPEGSWGELLPHETLACEGKDARGIEWQLRSRIYTEEHFEDDTVVEKEWVVHKAIGSTGWGLEGKHIDSTEARGAWKFDPVIKEPADLKKLRFPEITVDEAATQRRLAEMQDLFGDILTVGLKGVSHISFHLMSQYTVLRGLEEVMLDMYENPGMLHDAMAFLAYGHRQVIRQYVEMNLLSFNNDGTYHNSGGNGYTDELPTEGFDPNRVRLCDMWGSAEAQEMAQVSPEMHNEFILAYEKPLLEPFGLTGYGCCEDLTRKLDYVLTIPQIRRISIAPWADVDACADRLKGDYLFSWKPKPQHLVGDFNESALRDYIGHTIDVCIENGCRLEMILKDTHTCEGRAERFDRWTQIARELIEEKAGVMNDE